MVTYSFAFVYLFICKGVLFDGVEVHNKGRLDLLVDKRVLNCLTGKLFHKIISCPNICFKNIFLCRF